MNSLQRFCLLLVLSSGCVFTSRPQLPGRDSLDASDSPAPNFNGVDAGAASDAATATLSNRGDVDRASSDALMGDTREQCDHSADAAADAVSDASDVPSDVRGDAALDARCGADADVRATSSVQR